MSVRRAASRSPVAPPRASALQSLEAAIGSDGFYTQVALGLTRWMDQPRRFLFAVMLTNRITEVKNSNPSVGVLPAAAVCSGRVRVIQPVHAAGWFETAAPVLIALGTARVPVDLVDEDELLLVGLL